MELLFPHQAVLSPVSHARRPRTCEREAGPRQEHERVWAGYDELVANIQRQINEVKQAQGSVYGQRDIILDLRERLDRIERQRLGGG